MFVSYSFRNEAGYKAIAMLLATALLLWMVGAQFIGKQAQAANITTFSDTLSDSAPSTVSNHTIVFTMPNGMTTGQTFTLDFDASFGNIASIIEDDVDILVGGSSSSTAAAAGAATWGVAISNPTITFTTPTDGGVASGTEITIRVGTHAVTSGTGANQITNPAATTTSYTIDINSTGGTSQDSGQTRVAILDQVLVTAEVQTTFDFVVNGTPAGFTIPGVATTTDATTNSATLPFGVLAADTSKTLAHQLNVTTNAANGFVVTVEQSQDLQSSTGAIIDSFTDGTYLDTPAAWTAPGDNIAQDNTWGHWGLTSDDDDYSGTNDRWVAASTTPRIIFTHASSSDGVTNDIGSTTIGYQIQITPLQEAGNDYNTTLTYIATPTF